MDDSHLSRILNETPCDFRRFLTTAETEFTWPLRREVILLTLFFIGERPTASFAFVNTESSDMSEAHVLSDVLETLPVPSETVVEPFGAEFLSLSRYYPEAPDSYSLSDFETNEAYHQFWGEYYEYPQSAIDAFNNDTRLRYYSSIADKQHLIDTATERGWDQSDVAALPLIPFVPPRDPDGLADAIHIAHRHEHALRTVAKTHDIPELLALIESVKLPDSYFE
jgi:hypothetical protein